MICIIKKIINLTMSKESGDNLEKPKQKFKTVQVTTTSYDSSGEPIKTVIEDKIIAIDIIHELIKSSSISGQLSGEIKDFCMNSCNTCHKLVEEAILCTNKARGKYVFYSEPPILFGSKYVFNKTYTCMNCSKKCDKCGNYVCDNKNCVIICHACNKIVCSEHLTYKCRDCDIRFCSRECCAKCDQCENLYCQSCKKKNDTCHQGICHKCKKDKDESGKPLVLELRGGDCGRLICTKCIHYCSGCGDSFCCDHSCHGC
jgi:hypothetical protein